MHAESFFERAKGKSKKGAFALAQEILPKLHDCRLSHCRGELSACRVFVAKFISLQRVEISPHSQASGEARCYAIRERKDRRRIRGQHRLRTSGPAGGNRSTLCIPGFERASYVTGKIYGATGGKTPL
jgi:hypothetical protein